MKSVKTNFKSALIIDDDNDLCLLLKSILNIIIPSVDCADTLASGLPALVKLQPDVVFVDNNLPDGQSINFIPKMKELSPHSVIFLISAIDNFTENAKEYGADGFVGKPLSLDSIKKALEINSSDH